jgi:SEFIR domain-containing protein
MIAVFISYSHDSPEHADRVLALAERLRSDGIDATIDQYETSPPEGWHRWTDRHIRDAGFVLMVCSETYYRRVMGEERTGTGLGVRWEGNLIYQHFYDAGAVNRKFIPVLLGGDQPAHIPAPAKGVTFYRPDSESGYEDLYRRLTDQPRARKPVLGKLRQLPSRDRRWSERPVESDRSSERSEARDRRSEPPAGVEGRPGSSMRRSSRLNETVVLAPKAAQRGTGPNHSVSGNEVRTARRPGSFERGTHAHLGVTAAAGMGGLLIVAALTVAVTSMSPLDERTAGTTVEAAGGRSVDIKVWQGRLGEVYDVYKNGKFVGATTRYVLVSKSKNDQITCEKGGKTFIPISRGDDNGAYYCEKWW